MKRLELENIIYAAVKRAVREEVQSIITEAILTASTPEIVKEDKTKVIQPSKNSTSRVPHSEQTQDVTQRLFSNTGLGSLLEQTRQNMIKNPVANPTSVLDMVSMPSMKMQNYDDDETIEESVATPSPVGEFDFIKKAKAILDRSYEIDKAKKQV